MPGSNLGLGSRIEESFGVVKFCHNFTVACEKLENFVFSHPVKMVLRSFESAFFVLNSASLTSYDWKVEDLL